MKVLLIVPFTKTVYGYPGVPRLGLAYLSGSLENKGVDHEILDLNLYSDWKKVLNLWVRKYCIFGITSTTYEFDNAQKVAKYIKKKNPHSTIILGGPHTSLMGKEILEKTLEIDYCCRGEGEKSFPKLVKFIQAGHKKEIEKIDNLCFRKNGSVKCNDLTLIQNVDHLPFPYYEKFELCKYKMFPSTVCVLTSRGCPFGCIFCSVGLIMGKSFRARSPKNVLDEMETLIKKYGSTDFMISDDNFTLDIKRAKEICKGIIKRGFNIRWYLSNGVRADRLDDELVNLMRKSGCREIALGIENINNKILKRLKKGETIEDIKKAISLIQKYKIPIKGFFLIGAPGETENNARDNLEFAIDENLGVARFGMLVPYPGTELWNWIEKNHYWIIKEPYKAVTCFTDIGKVKALYETPLFRKKDKERIYNEIWVRWENYIATRNFRARIVHLLKRHPFLYTKLKTIHRKIKKD